MRPILLALLLAAALAGCATPKGSTPSTPGLEPVPDPSEAAPPTGTDAGTPAAHGSPQRTQSPVSVRVEDGQYVAEQDVTVTNDFGGASRARLQLGTRNGAVTAAAWEEGGYRLFAHLEGRGQTEDEARRALSTLAVVNSDALSSGLLELGFRVQFSDLPATLPVPPPVPLPEPGVSPVQRSASIVASLPAPPGYDLSANATNGGIAVTGLHGPRLDLGTTNGGLDVTGAWDDARLDTTNGNVRLAGSFNDLQVSSTNGGIKGRLGSGRTCTQEVETTNGTIDLQVQAGGRGYDVTGSTSNGRVDIDLPGAKASGEDTQRATTPGFASQAIQVTLEAQSTNGNIDVSST